MKSPTNVIKQIPDYIQERMSKNSSNEDIFNIAKCEFEDVLKKSGFKVHFKCMKNERQKAKNRTRNIIWFNPPFNNAVSANVAKIFVGLINKHFAKSHRLHKSFNRNTAKVSYSCIQNMSKIYNEQITFSPWNQLTLCNCRVKEECSMNGKCQTMDKPRTPELRRIYFGLGEAKWKKMCYNQKKPFKHKQYSHETTLSSYVWHVKNTSDVTPPLKW